MSIEPDTKDWTWVLDRRCPECGFDAGAVGLAEVPAVIRSQLELWPVVLRRPDVRERPEPGTWSALEYGAHVGDVFAVFAERLDLMLTRDDPAFPNWDQDAAATEGRYGEQDPAAVSAELVARGGALAEAFEAVPAGAADRPGRRSNGSRFTVLTLAQYLLHDLVHHAWDVTKDRAAPPGPPATPAAGVAAERAVEGDARDAEPGGDAEQPADGGGAEQPAGGAGAEQPAGDAEADPGGEALAEPTAATTLAEEQRELPPLQRFANRHRLVLGIALAVVALGFAVLFGVVLPDTSGGTGVQGAILRWAAPACWALVAGVSLSWALRANRTTTNGLAWLAVACYVAYLAVRTF